MLKPFKQYIAQQLINHTLRFKCDCLFPMDRTGIIKDYEIIDDEIVFKVLMGDRLISVGENHPNMQVDIL